MSDETPSHALDALVRDGVAEQRGKGLMPTPRAVADFILPILEEGEKKTEASRLRIKPKKPEAPTETSRRSTPEMMAEMKKKLARRGLEPLPGLEGGWTETRKPLPVVPSHKEFLSKKEALAKSRLRKRLRLLATLPEWRDRIRQVNPLALDGTLGIEKQNEAHAHIRKVVHDSDAVFGPWLADPKKKLIFT